MTVTLGYLMGELRKAVDTTFESNEDAADKMSQIMSAAHDLRPHDRNAFYKFAEKQAARMEKSIAQKKLDLDEKRGLIDWCTEVTQGHAALVDQLTTWVLSNVVLVIGRCDASKFSQCVEQGNTTRAKLDEISKLTGADIPIDPSLALLNKQSPQVFLASHNWARAFHGATDYAGGEVRMPYDNCAFEFVINGRHFIVHVDQELRDAYLYSKGDKYWFGANVLRYDPERVVRPDPNAHPAMVPLLTLLCDTIRAVCVAMDAEVVETPLVRVDEALQRARVKRGALPLYDYHVVQLARRHRADRPTPDPDREIVHRRLHFRRGHWRHYPSHKTWIKWMLVGNPDLGIVDKEYRV